MPSADVAIVGAGLAGLVTAIRLADAGARVVVLAEGNGSIHWAGGPIDVADSHRARRVPPMRFGVLERTMRHPYAVLGADVAPAPRMVPGPGGFRRAAVRRVARGALWRTADGDRWDPPRIPCPGVPGWGPSSRGETEERLVVAGQAGFKDFWPRAVAGSLSRPEVWGGHGGPGAPARVDGVAPEWPGLAERRNLNALPIANAFDDPAWRAGAVDLGPGGRRDRARPRASRCRPSWACAATGGLGGRRAGSARRSSRCPWCRPGCPASACTRRCGRRSGPRWPNPDGRAGRKGPHHRTVGRRPSPGPRRCPGLVSGRCTRPRHGGRRRWWDRRRARRPLAGDDRIAGRRSADRRLAGRRPTRPRRATDRIGGHPDGRGAPAHRCRPHGRAARSRRGDDARRSAAVMRERCGDGVAIASAWRAARSQRDPSRVEPVAAGDDHRRAGRAGRHETVGLSTDECSSATCATRCARSPGSRPVPGPQVRGSAGPAVPGRHPGALDPDGVEVHTPTGRSTGAPAVAGARRHARQA